MKFTDLLLNPDETLVESLVEKQENVNCFSLAEPLIGDVVECDTSVGKVKKFNSPFGDVIWNQTLKTIECSGAVFSEMEMHDMRDSGLGITDIDLAIRRNFPGGMEIRENTHFTTL